MKAASKVALVTALLSVTTFSASAQTGLSGIGPPKGAIAGAAVGLAAVTGGVLYLTLHKPSVTGCVRSVNGTNTLTDENDKLTYFISDKNFELRGGERAKLLGKSERTKKGISHFK